jgi:chemotaxis protein CheC
MSEIKKSENRPTFNPLLNTLARLGVQHAINGLSEMTGEEFTASEPELVAVPVLKVPEFVGGQENESVGVYLRATGEAAGQFMLILPIANALEFIDLMTMEPLGTTQELDAMGRSALAEMGNMVGSFFLNSIAELTGMESRPTEPDVMFDMVGAILNVVVATSVEQVEEVIIIRTYIMHGGRQTQANFWYIPDGKTMDILNERFS